MNDAPPFPYDEVRYPSLSHVHTHPDRMATLARLFGMTPPDVEHCNVLELGCGDGTNIIGMAFCLPQSTFLGLDLAGLRIAEGNQMIAELGLKNVRLRQADLLNEDVAQGTFDYIIAHGIYSWVPEPVRDRILGIIDACLSPNGVAFVSYNTYPGCHIRELMRRMMMFHVRATPEPSQKVAQGRAFLEFLATAREDPGTYQKLIQEELEHGRDHSDAAFYFDDLSPDNQPVYFHEFVAHAASHGLQYLADAEFSDMHPGQLKPSVMETLRELDDELLTREQYLDFLTGRRFRRTLLCRQEIMLERRIDPAVVDGMLAASNAQPVSGKPDIRSDAPEEFRTAKGASITANAPCAKAALTLLARNWPCPVAFSELLAELRKMCGALSATTADQDSATIRELLLRAYASGVLDLHVWKPQMLTTRVTEKPTASPVARYECRGGRRATTLRHTGLQMNDDLSRALVELLDGTRDIAALADALSIEVASGRVSMQRDGHEVNDRKEAREILSRELPGVLAGLARCAILVG